MTMAESIKYLLETKKAHDRHFIVGPNKVKIGVVTDLVVKCSDVLKAMLCDSEIRERGDVLMPDHHPDTIIIFLKFAYGAADSVTLSSDLRKWPAQTVLQVVDFAEKYNVAPLKQMAFNHFDHTLDNMNDFFLALHCVALYDATSLESAVLKVVQEKTQIVLAHAHFLLIDVESLILILKQNVLNVTEVELLKACLTWAVHKGKSKKDFNLRLTLEKPLRYIRLYNLTSEEFLTEVVPTGILTMQEIMNYSAAVKNKSFKGEVPFSNNIQKRFDPLVTETLTIDNNFYSVKSQNKIYQYKLCINNKNIKLKSLIFDGSVLDGYAYNNTYNNTRCVKICVYKYDLNGTIRDTYWNNTFYDNKEDRVQFDQQGLFELIAEHNYKFTIELNSTVPYTLYKSNRRCQGHKLEFGSFFCLSTNYCDILITKVQYTYN
uniref:BACK domain-containing protein n=1 Tax=Homalodisca liturata TaxID=320908 RepID=A0A1B6JZU2_9HEMI